MGGGLVIFYGCSSECVCIHNSMGCGREMEELEDGLGGVEEEEEEEGCASHEEVALAPVAMRHANLSALLSKAGA